MTNLKAGKVTLNLGIVKLTGDLTEEDRQCAWELYTELSTRVAVTGKLSDPDCTNFDGELYIESLASVYKFFQEARLIMRKFPVGRLEGEQKNHLGIIISNVLSDVLRPFLEKWQVDYRHWWENQSNPRLSPLDRQGEYPKIKDFLGDWSNIRIYMRQLQNELIQVYQLVNVHSEK